MLAEDDGGAHESVGGDGAEEADFGLEVDLGVGDTFGVAEPGLIIEEMRELAEQVDGQDTSDEVGDEDHAPVVEELADGDPPRHHSDQQAHSVSSEELAAINDDEKDSHWEKEPSN